MMKGNKKMGGQTVAHFLLLVLVLFHIDLLHGNAVVGRDSDEVDTLAEST